MTGGMTDGKRREAAAGSDASKKGCLTPAAFAERFEGASRTLWCIAAAVVGDRSAAEDVLQEAAVIALGKLEQFDPETNFLAWMARIVRFVALNHGRRRAVHKPIDPDALDQAPIGGAGGRNMAGREEATRLTLRVPTAASGKTTLNGHGDLLQDQEAFDDRVLAALKQLEPNARACLLLRVVLNMPYREIARALDVAEGTAMSHVHRARMSLREALTPQVLSGKEGPKP